MNQIVRLLALWAALACFASPMVAADEPKEDPASGARESPWLLLPTVSANPKLGTSVGAIAAYLHYFDEQSRPSMFGLAGQYTSKSLVPPNASL